MKLEIYWIEQQNETMTIRNYGYKKIVLDKPLSDVNLEFKFDKTIGIILNIEDVILKLMLTKYNYYVKVENEELVKLINFTQITSYFNKIFNTNIPTHKTFDVYEKISKIEGDFET